MLYTDLTQRAMEICFEAHHFQSDKGGVPYCFHPYHLAEQMETEEEICTAMLHDVMEDTKMTREDLAAEGFPEEVLEALVLLTHDKKKYPDYMDYVRNLSSCRLAARVKLADLRHNSTRGRLKNPGKEKNVRRLKKYLKAQAVLTGGRADLEVMTLTRVMTVRRETGEGCRGLSEAASGLSGAPSGPSAAPAGAEGAGTLPVDLELVCEPDGRFRAGRILSGDGGSEGGETFTDLCGLADHLTRMGVRQREIADLIRRL